MTDLATSNGADIIERVIAAGDLARLSPEQRTSYYLKVCESLGLNPLTRPFEYLTLNQKLVLYATRGATDQLRRVHRISTAIVSRETIGDVYVVTAKASDPTGRADESIGAVAIGGLKGDALCNALMKAETKAKRRATLAIVGLSFLDETELETIPGARVESDEPTPIGQAGRLAAEAVEEPASASAPAGVPGDDVDALSGLELVDACDRMRRQLDAANLPYQAMPNPRTNTSLRAWWKAGSALLAART